MSHFLKKIFTMHHKSHSIVVSELIVIFPQCTDDMIRDARKPVLLVSDQVQHKLACTSTEDALNLEILD